MPIETNPDLLPGYDAWKTHDPAEDSEDEYAGLSAYELDEIRADLYEED